MEEQFRYVTCPACKVRLRARASARAVRLRCPMCSNVFALTAPETTAPSPPAAAPPPETKICGFWRRVLALIIDSVLIGAVGFVLGLFMFGILAKLGSLGLLVGFALALLYFGIMNSSVGRGKTLGKRWLGINVVGRDGKYISVPRSFLRYAVLSVPFFLNGAYIPLPESLSKTAAADAMNLFLALIVFGAGGAILYLYIFNRRTRQSLHDLAVGSFVVVSPAAGRVKTLPVWKGHAAVLAVWILLITAGTLVAAPVLVDKFAGKEAFAEMAALQEDIHKTGNVHYATVHAGTQTYYTLGGAPPKKSQYLQITAVWKGTPDDLSAACMKIARVVMKEYPRVDEQDRIVITVKYGFSIGIASAWKSYNLSASPQELRQRLMKSGQEVEI